MRTITFIKKAFPKILAGLLPLGLSAQSSLHITSGCKMVLAGASKLVLNDISFVNDGVLSSSLLGLVRFMGTANPNVSIGGVTTSTFGTLQFFRPVGDITLNGDIKINFVLSLNQGRIRLNNHNIGLGTSGAIMAESSVNYITSDNGGSITVTRTFIGGATLNPGNIGLEITPANGSNTGGTWTVTRRHQSVDLNGKGIVSIKRTFNVTGSQSASTNFRVRYFYNDVDVFDALEDQMVVWNQPFLGGDYNQLGKDSNSTTANWVALSGIHSLINFALGQPSLGNGDPSVRDKTKKQSSALQSLTDPSSPLTAAAAKVYPNPAHDLFTIDISSPGTQQMRISLFDQSGHLMQQKDIYCQTGKNTISWDMGKFSAGVYYLSFDNGSLKNIKIVKE